MNSIVSSGADATGTAGEALAPLLAPGDVLLLSGDLGAGKTTLVRGIAHGLGVAEETTSPTFNIMLVHPGRLTLYHIDLYRLDDADQLEDIDYWETLEADGVAAVEWGDRFPEAQPTDHLAVEISITGDEERIIGLLPSGSRGAQLARAWLLACEGMPGLRIDAGVQGLLLDGGTP